MTEHKFTDEEIIKALECCGEIDRVACDSCSFDKECDCVVELAKRSLDLINRQKAETAYWMDEAVNAKREAVKAFAKRLHKSIDDFRDKREMVMLPYTESALLCIERRIDNLVKEMTEGKT